LYNAAFIAHPDPEGRNGETRWQAEMPKRHVLVSVDVVPSLAEANVWGSSRAHREWPKCDPQWLAKYGACCSARQAAQKLGGKGEEFQHGKVWKRLQEK
jgi:hypothetical protein